MHPLRGWEAQREGLGLQFSGPEAIALPFLFFHTHILTHASNTSFSLDFTEVMDLIQQGMLVPIIPPNGRMMRYPPFPMHLGLPMMHAMAARVSWESPH